MKKFEIINDKWIKVIGEGTISIKISTITGITGSYRKKDYDGFEEPYPYSISLSTNGQFALDFSYKATEKENFDSDLKYLENLLYNR